MNSPLDSRTTRGARQRNQRTLLGFAVVTGAMAGANVAWADPFSIVGGSSYGNLADAVAAASSGATIDVAGGTYVDQSATIPTGDTLTIQSVGGAAVFNAVSPLANEQGVIETFGNLTVNGLTFENAAISDDLGGNGAGIRYKQGNLTVLNSSFLNNQEGILGDADPTGSVLINHSTFTGNGNPSDSAGHEHAIYVTEVGSLTVKNSTITGTTGSGSDIQSRAALTTVVNNVMDDGVGSDANYAVNVANGGVAVITGNSITKGPLTTNHRIIAYGAAGTGTYADNSLTVTGNTFTSTDPFAIGIDIFASDGLTDTLSPNTYAGTFVSDIVLPSDPPPPSGSSGPPSSGATADPPPDSIPEPGGLTLFLGALAALIGARAFGRARPPRKTV